MHIGVHKTGTTAVQDSLAQCRPLLGQWRVRYPGRNQAHRDVASSAMGRQLGWRTDGARPPEPGLWDRFVSGAHSFNGVTVLSSEFLAEASAEKAQQMIADVGADRVHVVVTLRNLGKILPSAWQQILKSGYETPYATWLDRTLNVPVVEPKPGTFWNRHRHDEVVLRWAALVGPERVTVVVVDDAHREDIYWHFEDLLGLPRNTLLDHRVASNRSMTLPEAEFLRRLNSAVGGRKGWREYNHRVHDRLVKGIVESRLPPADEPRLQTPQWALDRAAELARGFVAAISESGVRVMGELGVLSEQLHGPEAISRDALDQMPMDAAVAALLGATRPRAQEVGHTETSVARKLIWRLTRG